MLEGGQNRTMITSVWEKDRKEYTQSSVVYSKFQPYWTGTRESYCPGTAEYFYQLLAVPSEGCQSFALPWLKSEGSSFASSTLDTTELDIKECAYFGLSLLIAFKRLGTKSNFLSCIATVIGGGGIPALLKLMTEERQDCGGSTEV